MAKVGGGWGQLMRGELIQPEKNITTYCLEMLMNIYD